ncbi:hypothetical protein AAG906_041173 [Vitis piasezkii]
MCNNLDTLDGPRESVMSKWKGLVSMSSSTDLLVSLNALHGSHKPQKCKQEAVRWKALTEEHARDSFENLLFSVVSYDFKEERFAYLHRSAIGFPESRFFYSGTPASSTSKEAAMKGEALVRAQFHDDPYGCSSSLRKNWAVILFTGRSHILMDALKLKDCSNTVGQLHIQDPFLGLHKVTLIFNLF